MATQDDLRQSFKLTKTEDPDAYAKSLGLAGKTGIPVDVVHRNQAKVEQEYFVGGVDYDGMTKAMPRVSGWLKDPDNSAVAKDDLQVLGNHERLAANYSTWEKVKSGVAQGLTTGWAKPMSQVPGLAVDIAAAAFAPPNMAVKAPDYLYKNPLTQKLEQTAEAYKLPDFEPKLLESIKAGQLSRAGSDLAYHLASNAPSIVQSIVTGFGSKAVQAVSLGLMGAQTAAGAAETAREKGMGPSETVAYATAYGAAEVIPEKISFGLFKPWASAIENAVSKDTAKRVITDAFKTLIYNTAGEGSEEVVTTAAQAMTDYYTGVDKDALNNLPQEVVESFIVGAAMGGGMQGPAIIGVGAKRGLDMRRAAAQVKQTQDFYTAMGKDAEASKLRERLPEKYQDALHQIVKDGPVENIFMPIQEFEEYAEAKGVDPLASMIELGLQNEYSQAKAAGTDITIPLAQFVTKLVPTEHYQGLRDAVKFDPNGLTGGEYKKLLKEAAAGAKEMEAQAETESAQAAQEYTEGLTKAGLTADQAATNAVLLENALKRIASSESQRTGAYVSPMDIWKENRIRIMSGGEGAIGALEQTRRRATGEPAEAILARTFAGMDQSQREAAFLTDPKTGLLGENAHAIGRESVPAGYELGHLQFEGTKYFNDSISHSAGDDIYRMMAKALESMEADGLIQGAAKVGGDFEFQIPEGQGPAVEAELKKRLPAKARAGSSLFDLSKLGVIVSTGAEARDAGDVRKEAEIKAGNYAERGKAPVGATALGAATEADLPDSQAKGIITDALRAAAKGRITDWRSIYVGKDGMLNATGWDALEKAGRKQFVVHADLDHLGLTNKDFPLFGGKENARVAGDKILSVASEVMSELLTKPEYAGIDAAHISGDEYYFQGNDSTQVQKFLTELEGVLNNPLHVEIEGRKVMVKPGITGSFGIGVSHDDAEHTALANKQERADDRQAHGWRELAKGESIDSVRRPMGRSGVAASEGVRQAHDRSVSAESEVGPIPGTYLQGGSPVDLVWDEDVAEDFDNRMVEEASALISAFGRGRKRAPWKVVPAARLSKIWKDFSETGFVRDEDGLNQIAESILNSIARLDFTNKVGGHDTMGFSDALEIAGVENFDMSKEDAFLEFLVDKNGTWLVSDYGLPKLMKLYPSILGASTAEQKLVAIDRALNVVHPRSDLAALLVEGGSNTLAKLSAGTTLHQSLAPAFYSKLVKLVEAKMPAKASVEQVRGLTKEISAEERKFLGLDDFLKDHQQVSKPELLEFLAANDLGIKEVTRGTRTASLYKEAQARLEADGFEIESDDYFGITLTRNGEPVEPSDLTPRQQEDATMLEEGDDSNDPRQVGDTKFSDYQLPGGENYREVLFTLGGKVDAASRRTVGQVSQEMFGKKYSELTDDEQRQAVAEYNKAIDKADAAERAAFKSSHWSEPNVFAHVRLNDRVDADGKKVLFVEEIQSDWHQKGRKEGYKSDNVFGIVGANGAKPHLEFKTREDAQRYLDEFNIEDATIEERAAINSGVPDAPFRKTWQEFAFKRIVRMAAEGGYDRIAWTTGAQQVDRYPNEMRKVVDSFAWSGESAGKKIIDLYKGGDSIGKLKVSLADGIVSDAVNVPQAQGKHLSEIIGKDMAAKILADQSEGEIQGKDFTVGGEGMKGFYDKILPDYANKFGKKFGAKVGETTLEIPGEEDGRLQTVASAEDADNYEKFYVKNKNGMREISKDEALKKIKGTTIWGEKPKNTTPVHSLDLTPAMRDAALGEGFSLFQPVYHGTPHKFDKFTLDHIGSGEGAQAYGHGLYFASEKAVADYYRETTAGAIVLKALVIGRFEAMKAEQWKDYSPKDNSPYEQAKASIVENLLVDQAGLEAEFALGGEKAVKKHVLKAIDDQIADWEADGYTDGVTGAKQFRAEVQRHGVKMKGEKPGNTYAADIPEDSELLDYDKPLSEQGIIGRKAENAVRDILKKKKYLGAKDDGPRQLARAIDAYRMTESRGLDTKKGLTGELAYSMLQNDLGSPEAASRYLLSLGIPGLRYLDQTSRNMRSGTDKGSYNYVIWDENAIQMMTELEQAQRGGIRGSLTLPTERTPEFVMSLFKDWNLSTPPHEFGHYYLEMLHKYASLPGASEELTKDYGLVRDYLGMTADQAKPTREQHELFADSLLKYLQEGKAPTRQLEGFFAKMKVWLLALYREAADWANINLTPEIRGVFDRMLASEEGVAEARQEQGLTPLFPAGTTGNLEYDALIAADAEQASAEVLQRQLDLYNKRRQAWASQEREIVEAEQTERIMSQPIHKAITAMTADGGPKIDPATLPADIRKGFPRKLLSKDAGLPAQVVAEMMGFPDGMDFARNLKAATPAKLAIKNATEVEMAHRYPAPIDTDEMPVEVQDAIHNEKRAQRLALEMQLIQEQNPEAFKGLLKSVAKRPRAGAAMKAYAQELVDAMSVGDLKPERFLRAETKAANKAARLLASNDAVGALEAKQREMLNHEIYVATRASLGRLEKSMDKWKGFAKPDEKLAKSRDMALVNAGRAVLAQIGLAPDTEKSASAYLAPLAEYDPNAAASAYAIVNSLAPKAQNYLTMSTKDFTALAEGIDALWRLSRTSHQVKTRDGVVERDEARAELEAQFLSFRTPPSVTQAGTTDAEKQAHAVSSVRALLTRVESWVDLMDNGDINGPFRKYLWTPVKDATIEYRARLEEQMAGLKSLLEPLRGHIGMEPITADELGGFTFQNKGQLLGALLHSGNDSNLEKLLRGYGWGQVDEAGNLDRSKWDAFVARAMQDGTITKQDMDFVQGVWDLLDGTKKPAQQAHMALYGYAFSEVTAAPVQTPWGEYRGGYFPAVTDKYKVPSQVSKDEKELFEGGQNTFMFPSTSKGFTKARTDYAAPLSLDLGLIGNHVDKVMRFAYLQPTVSSVYRLTKDRGMDALMGNDIRDLLTPWLQRVATQRVATPGMSAAMDRFYSALRSRAGLAQMVLNIPNTLQQFTGLALSSLRIGPKYLAHTAREYVGNSKAMAEFMNEKSSFMRGRVSAQIMDIQADIKEILLNPTAVDTVKDFAQRNGYILQTTTQGVVDAITWRAAYDQAIAEGLGEQAAVDSADAAVTLTQGSFGAESVARFETGSPAVRLFTMFAGYFNMQANLLGTEFAKVHQDLGWRKGAGRVLYIGTMGLVVPAIVSKLIMSAFYGHGDDEDYDLSALLQDMGMGIVDNVLGFVPVAGNAARMVVGKYLTPQPWDDKMSLTPAVKIIESTVSAPESVYQAIVDKAPPSKAVKDVLTAFSFMTGIPAAPLAKPLGYVSDVADREQIPQGALDVARGLTTGRQ